MDRFTFKDHTGKLKFHTNANDMAGALEHNGFKELPDGWVCIRKAMKAIEPEKCRACGR